MYVKDIFHEHVFPWNKDFDLEIPESWQVYYAQGSETDSDKIEIIYNKALVLRTHPVELDWQQCKEYLGVAYHRQGNSVRLLAYGEFVLEEREGGALVEKVGIFVSPTTKVSCFQVEPVMGKWDGHWFCSNSPPEGYAVLPLPEVEIDQSEQLQKTIERQTRESAEFLKNLQSATQDSKFKEFYDGLVTSCASTPESAAQFKSDNLQSVMDNMLDKMAPDLQTASITGSAAEAASPLPTDIDPFSRPDPFADPDPFGPDPFAPDNELLRRRGTVLETAVFACSPTLILEVPEEDYDWEVIVDDKAEQISVTYEKYFGYGGWVDEGDPKYCLDNYEASFGLAFKNTDNVLRLIHYGTFHTFEGGASIGVRITVPKNIEVKRFLLYRTSNGQEHVPLCPPAGYAAVKPVTSTRIETRPQHDHAYINHGYNELTLSYQQTLGSKIIKGFYRGTLEATIADGPTYTVHCQDPFSSPPSSVITISRSGASTFSGHVKFPEVQPDGMIGLEFSQVPLLETGSPIIPPRARRAKITFFSHPECITG